MGSLLYQRKRACSTDIMKTAVYQPRSDVVNLWEVIVILPIPGEVSTALLVINTALAICEGCISIINIS
jgi:hypothetical protein